jgi:hypothetical protein
MSDPAPRLCSKGCQREAAPRQFYCRQCHRDYMRMRRGWRNGQPPPRKKKRSYCRFHGLLWRVKVGCVVVARFRDERDAKGFARARYPDADVTQNGQTR